MDRREVLVGGAALAAAAVMSSNAQAGATAAMPAGHQHMAPDNPLNTAAAQCVQTGEVCLQHCLMMLSSGDTSMADCAKSVSDMLAVAPAILQLNAAMSKYTKPMAKLVVDVVKDCEATCRKHADKHAVCKACADCCAKLQQEAAKI